MNIISKWEEWETLGWVDEFVIDFIRIVGRHWSGSQPPADNIAGNYPWLREYVIGRGQIHYCTPPHFYFAGKFYFIHLILP